MARALEKNEVITVVCCTKLSVGNEESPAGFDFLSFFRFRPSAIGVALGQLMKADEQRHVALGMNLQGER